MNGDITNFSVRGNNLTEKRGGRDNKQGKGRGGYFWIQDSYQFFLFPFVSLHN